MFKIYSYLVQLSLFFLFLSLLNGCAKSQEEKELKIADNNISIRLEGSTYPIERQNVIASTAGKIKHLYIKYGDKVTKGTLLYTLDRELLELDIKNKKIEIASLKQIKQHLISRRDSISTRASLNLAAIELKKIAQLKAEGYVEDFTQDIYKKNYINLLNIQKKEAVANNEKLQTVEESLRAKKIALQQLQYQLKYMDGYANIDGFVADIQIQEGQTIEKDAKICTIVNLDKVMVRAGFATGLLPFLHRNQQVKINFITTPPYTVEGVIHQIIPIVDPTFENMTLNIILPNKNYALQEGTRALVTVKLPKEGQKRVKEYFMNNKKERVIEVQSKI